jgi:small subunit ribosomal protein S3
MGQKVNPIGLRVGVIRDWDSKWIGNDKETITFIGQDKKIRDFISSRLQRDAAIARIRIARTRKDGQILTRVIIEAARPGVILGPKGESVKKLKLDIKKAIKVDVEIDVVEIKNPDITAQIIADNLAIQLENRASFRTIQKRAIQTAMRSGAKGIKTAISGRLGGVDMARSEGYSEGNVPLHTIRADVDYATAEAHTTYGRLGIKVWVYHGEVLPVKGGK